MMKKRFLALLLAAASVFLASCSTLPVGETVPAQTEDSVTASADVSAAASWLADKTDGKAQGSTVTIGSHTVHLTFGSAAAELGVSTDALRAEGYTIRTVGDTSVIAAKTESGLDAAVRKYFAEFDQTGSPVVNVTSGHKIGQIILGGADIRTYTIFLPQAEEGDTTFAATSTLAMKNAAGEIVKYIELATGHKLPIQYVTNLHKMSDADIKAGLGNAIVLLSDPTAKSGSSLPGETGEMGTESYKLTVEEGIMRILGGNQRGCVYGVYDFLEKYIGWRFLGDDVEYLYDAEELVINDVDDTHTPTFGYRATTMPAANDSNNFPKMKQNCFNTTRYAHAPDWGYGLGSTYLHAHTFSYQVEPGMQGSQPYGDQPCLTDEYTKEVIINSMLGLINERLNPPFNTRIGYDTVQIGCSMNDNTNFCKCQNCMKVARETSFSDLYLSFVNDCAAAVEEAYPGIIVNTAIYFNARKPPVETVPRDNVSIYYCVQGCNAHTIPSGDCEGHKTSLGTNNVTEKAQLEAWAEICDRVYVWHYATTFFSTLTPCPNVYQLYDDVTYVASLGVFGFYGEGDTSGNNSFENLKAYIFCRLMYDADMTREEFHAMVDEYITIVYGEESAPYIIEYLDAHQKAGAAIGGCFINNYHLPFDMVSYEYIKANFGMMSDLFDKAMLYARDAATEAKIEKLRIHEELLGLSATYFRDYVNGTADSRAAFEAKYKWLVDTARRHNLDCGRLGSVPSNYDLSLNPMFKFIPDLAVLSKENLVPSAENKNPELN